MSARILALMLAAAGLFAAHGAVAHKPSDSYLTLQQDGRHIMGQWDIALRDLDHAIGLDVNNDGAITWGEVRARQNAIDAYALSNLSIQADGAACPMQPRAHLIDEHSDGTYAVLRFTADCPDMPRALSVTYTLFFDIDPQHRGLLRLVRNGRSESAVLSPAQDTLRVGAAPIGIGRQFLDYFREGVWHIWLGLDHILFLLALLLPAVLHRENDHWRAVTHLRDAFVDTVQVVTAFTLAHSITLSLAALKIVHLPSQLVESGIAVSVLIAALNNIWPIFTKRLWLVAFAFGLIHGLGFANVLTELGLPRDSLVVSLVGFNLGVEAGQLVIVAAFVPLAYLFRRSWAYPHLAMRLGSISIAILATGWLIERGFDLVIF